MIRARKKRKTRKRGNPTINDTGIPSGCERHDEPPA